MTIARSIGELPCRPLIRLNVLGSDDRSRRRVTLNSNGACVPVSGLTSLWFLGGFAKSTSDLAVDLSRAKLQTGSKMVTVLGAQYFDRAMKNPLNGVPSSVLTKSLQPWTNIKTFAKDDDMDAWVKSFAKLKATNFKDAVDRFSGLPARTLQVAHHELTSTGEINTLAYGGMVGTTTTTENTALAVAGVDPVMEVLQNAMANSRILSTTSGGAAGFASLAIEEMLGTGKLQSLLANDLTNLARPSQGVNMLFAGTLLKAAYGISKGFPAQYWAVIVWPERVGAPKVLTATSSPESDDPLTLLQLVPKQPASVQLQSIDIEDDT